MTAAELNAQLENDDLYQRKLASLQEHNRKIAAEGRYAESEIVEELREVGVDVEEIWDLVNRTEPYPQGLPILMDHLERLSYPDRTLEGLASALAVAEARPFWHRLVRLFREVEGEDARQGLAAAVSATVGPEHYEELLSLINDSALGEERIILLEGLIRSDRSRARNDLEHLSLVSPFSNEARRLLKRKLP